MSIFSKINEIVQLRNGIRTKLLAFGKVTSTAKLQDCKMALEGMTDNTKKTTTNNSIKGSFFSGVSQKIFGKVGEGYCSANSLVEIPIANLIASNIQNGVNVGGVVGSYTGPYILGGTLTIYLYDTTTANAAVVCDLNGALFEGSIPSSGTTKVLYFTGPFIFVGGSAFARSYSGCTLIRQHGSVAAIFRATSSTVSISMGK